MPYRNHKPATAVRNAILARKQLRKVDTGNLMARAHLTNKLPPDPSGNKSSLMRYIEGKYGQPIEVLIWIDGVDTLSKQLEIPSRSISRWRKKYPNGNR